MNGTATAGSGQAISEDGTRVSQTTPEVTLDFDANGNIVQGFGIANYEPTTEQVVNVELFENALRFGAGL